MKRFLLVLCTVFTSVMMFGQTRSYGVIMANVRVTTGKITVKVTFEENQKKFAPQLQNEQGEPIEFTSLIGAMNHLSKYGWELEDTYTSTLGERLTELQTFYWVISRPEDELVKDNPITE